MRPPSSNSEKKATSIGLSFKNHEARGGRGLGKMKAARPLSVTIRQIEFELEKAEHGMGLPYDPERVGQLRGMLREARKRKLSAGLKARREQGPR